MPTKPAKPAAKNAKPAKPPEAAAAVLVFGLGPEQLRPLRPGEYRVWCMSEAVIVAGWEATTALLAASSATDPRAFAINHEGRRFEAGRIRGIDAAG